MTWSGSSWSPGLVHQLLISFHRFFQRGYGVVPRERGDWKGLRSPAENYRTNCAMSLPSSKDGPRTTEMVVGRLSDCRMGTATAELPPRQFVKTLARSVTASTDVSKQPRPVRRESPPILFFRSTNLLNSSFIRIFPTVWRRAEFSRPHHIGHRSSIPALNIQTVSTHVRLSRCFYSPGLQSTRPRSCKDSAHARVRAVFGPIHSLPPACRTTSEKETRVTN